MSSTPAAGNTHPFDDWVWDNQTLAIVEELEKNCSRAWYMHGSPPKTISKRKRRRVIVSSSESEDE